MITVVPVAQCYKCDEYIYAQREAHALVDGFGRRYGYHCESCAEGAFDDYNERISE